MNNAKSVEEIVKHLDMMINEQEEFSRLLTAQGEYHAAAIAGDIGDHLKKVQHFIFSPDEAQMCCADPGTHAPYCQHISDPHATKCEICG